MYQLKIEEYQVRDYVLEANGTKLSFRPRSVDQLVQGLALKIRGALHQSIVVSEHPDLDMILIQLSDKRVNCAVSTEDPKLKLLPLSNQTGSTQRSEAGTQAPAMLDPLLAWVEEEPKEAERWLAVSHADVKLLQRRINFLLGRGWLTQGALVSHEFSGQLVQVMVRG